MLKVKGKVFGRSGLAVIAIAAQQWSASVGHAATPLPINSVAVERIGGDANGGGAATAATSVATAVFVDDFSLGQANTRITYALPTTVNVAQLALTDSGSATSDGYLSLAGDGSVIVPGYNDPVGTAGIASSSPAAVARVIGKISADGTIDTSTNFTNGASANFRGVASPDGVNYYIGYSGDKSNFGVGYLASGTTAAVALTNGNDRIPTLASTGGGVRLFVSSSSTTGNNGTAGYGVVQIGPGTLPTATTTNTAFVTGGSTPTSPSPYQFAFGDVSSTISFDGTGADELYVADDRSAANGGGLQKYTYNGSVWTLQYTITSPAALTGKEAGSYRGMTLAGLDSNGHEVIYVTTTGSTTGNAILQIIDSDTTAAAAAVTDVNDSPDNTFYRGVAFVPEPGCGILLCLGLGVVIRRRVERGGTPARPAR